METASKSKTKAFTVYLGEEDFDKLILVAEIRGYKSISGFTRSILENELRGCTDQMSTLLSEYGNLTHLWAFLEKKLERQPGDEEEIMYRLSKIAKRRAMIFDRMKESL